MLKTVFGNPWVRAVGVLLALGLLVFLCWALSPVLVPMFFAFLVAYILNPVVDLLERYRIRRSISIAIGGLVIILALLAIPVYVIPSMIQEADRLIRVATEEVTPESVSDALHPPTLDAAEPSRASEWFQRMLDRLPVEDFLRDVGWVEPDEEVTDPLAVIVANIVRVARDHTLEFLREHALVFASAGQHAGAAFAFLVAAVGRGTYGVLIFLGSLALFVFVGVYLLMDFHGLVEGAKALTPPRYRDKVFSIVSQIDHNIHGWLRGQLLVCVSLAVMYSVGLSVSGTPFALLIAWLGGFASLAPYLGPALTVIPALALTLVKYGGFDWHAVGVLATVAAAQTLEGNVLTPKIVGGQVGLHPVWVILAVMVFASWFGFLGLLLAVPIAATLKVFVVEAVTYYKRSPVFVAEAGDDPGGASETGEDD